MDPDILVVGGGILGFSSAYHLKSENPDRRIIVIDKNSGPAQGNTAKSEGAFRNVFASATNYLLADSTIDWLQHLQGNLGYNLKLNYLGYLWLFSEAQHNRVKSILKKMIGNRIELKAMEVDAIKKAVPDLVVKFPNDDDAELMGIEPVDIGFFAPKCGSVDADSTCHAYEAEFMKLGGEVRYNTEAKRLLIQPRNELGVPGEPFIWQEKVVTGAETNKGLIKADTTIIATGAWSEHLLNTIGIDPMMRPKKRQLFVFKDPKLKGLMHVKGLNREGVLPLTILPTSGVYLKGEATEGSIWLGCADNVGRRFGLEEDPQPEEEYYTNNIYHVLVKYLPCFSNLRPMNMWAGQYAINSLDLTPVVTSSPGMIYVGAASGSGIMKSDALGRIVAAEYAGRRDADLFGGRKFRVSDLGIENRNVEKETFVI
jgi:FAD-dependent oxidoreductase domain-containing protein 1